MTKRKHDSCDHVYANVQEPIVHRSTSGIYTYESVVWEIQHIFVSLEDGKCKRQKNPVVTER